MNEQIHIVEGEGEAGDRKADVVEENRAIRKVALIFKVAAFY